MRITLRTIDQYSVWRARVHGYCWATTRRDVFSVTDDQCVEATNAFEKGESKHDWVGKAWITINSSLHDDLFMKVCHIEQGHLASLLAEIRSALLVNTAEDIQPLRSELYALTMQSAGNDLQLFISGIVQRKEKLAFLKVVIPDEELVHIFTRGLHPIFTSLQVVWAVPGQTPETFEQAVTTVRKYSSMPAIHSQLLKLKSHGLSQNVFAAEAYAEESQTIALNNDKHFCLKFMKSGSCSFGEKCKFLHPSTVDSQRQLPSPKPVANRPRCTFCRYKGHTESECRKKAAEEKKNSTITLAVAVANDAPSGVDAPPPQGPVFDYLFAFKVETYNDFTRKEGNNATYAITTQQGVVPAAPRDLPLVAGPPFLRGGTMGCPSGSSIPIQNSENSENTAKSAVFDVFVENNVGELDSSGPKWVDGLAYGPVEAAKALEPSHLILHARKDSDNRPTSWILDSGATISATYSPEDCINITPCNVSVTAAGCSFWVHQKGTAVIRAKGANGLPQVLHISECLISQKFPYKLLALQIFANKGYTVVISGDSLSVQDSSQNPILTGVREISSRLYVLRLEEEEIFDAALEKGVICGMAKSYTGGHGKNDGPSNALLWKLHLRHGHKNWRDLCRQYGLPLPPVPPTCASCIMGKAHLHPPISDGFERAKRRAEGFHSDFRGPFSTPTPSGCVYFLSLIDDYSRRVFGFLCKSQDEWLDIWRRFVAWVAVKIGRPGCMAWILLDNGSVHA